MTQVCSLSSSATSVNDVYNNKRLPKGIHIVETGGESVPKVRNISKNELPWGYIFIQHMSAMAFEKKLATRMTVGDFKPKCFVHRTIKYRKKTKDKGIVRAEVPTVSGLVFLQGTTRQLKSFLIHNYPQYFLVNDCSTGKPASIPDSIMQPFMAVMENESERVTFLRDPFVKFAKDHVKLRVLTGLFKGLEGYVIRIDRDRQFVMNIGGYAVAFSNVHNEDFEIAE